ncbi:MAG TPA: MSMEG_0569 family flavin-dependent oxidoreductase [Stenomitos sp.]
MTQHYPVIIVGGGQAGLSMSYCLKERGIEHLIFEKHRIGHEWRSRRWDSFCLVTPNWQCQLPGFPYDGHDAHGFMQKEEIVAFIERYAATFDPPIREGVTVSKVRQTEGELFAITTSIGDFSADQVVIAVGGYHKPNIPRLAERLSAEIVQLHSSEYKNPQSLPEGSVLVVGSGQSGCQIAEDLHLAGKTVHLCVGTAPRSPRRYRNKDVVDWLDQMGYYDLSIEDHPQKENARRNTNHYLTGRDGGREIDLRQFALEGMQLYGRLQGIDSGKLHFKPDLAQNLDHADNVAANIKQSIDTFIAKNQIDVPTEASYQPVWKPKTERLSLDYQAANITSVIWSTGYQSNFSWIEVPVFHGNGYPGHVRGVTDVRGLYFLGLPWLHTWGSGRFSGIARDATYLADYIVARRQASRAHVNAWSIVNEFLLGS